MKRPYELKDSHQEIICPDCGSSEIEKDDDHIAETGDGKPLQQYVCKKCKITFIPATTGIVTDDKKQKINDWSSKVRQSEGLNEGRRWSVDRSKIIIIRKK